MGMVGLQSPWVTLAEEIKELFKNDPEVKYEYDGQYEVKLFVDNEEKADALTKLIPPVRMIGNIVFKVTVVPADGEEEINVAELFEKAFEGNPVLSFVAGNDDPAAGPTATYAVFENKVVQFYNDDLSDYYRNKTTLYQSIAYDVFGEELGIYFCTDVPEPPANDEEEEEDDYEEDEESKEFTADE